MAKLNNEKTNEILKAAAFGYTADAIAAVMMVDVADINAILEDSQDEIAAIQKRYSASKLGELSTK